jgi:hypothetical protein
LEFHFTIDAQRTDARQWLINDQSDAGMDKNILVIDRFRTI